MKKDIFIILPYKESLNPNFAGAVSLYVKDTTDYSKYKKRIQIISSDDFDNKSELFRNKNYIINFCKKYQFSNIKIIEIHNRPEYYNYIKKYFPTSKIKLIFHNDPLSLRGSISLKERENIITSFVLKIGFAVRQDTICGGGPTIHITNFARTVIRSRLHGPNTLSPRPFFHIFSKT